MTPNQMEACISLSDIAAITQEEIIQTEETAARYNPNQVASCEDFYKKVRSLESTLICAYKFGCRLAKRTTNLKELCYIWKTTSDICDAILTLMKRLKDTRPDCGTPQLYDLALDYKNAAFKRYQQNLEALQWEKTEIPAGLFPKNS